MSFNPVVTKPAAHSLRRAEMFSSLADLDQNEEFFPSIVHRVSEGIFLSEIAKELRVTYSVLRNWIRGNKEKDEEYKQAEADGKKARVEQVMKKIHTAATAEVTAELSHADQLRAGEILLKQEQQEEARKAPSTIANIQINFVGSKDGKPQEKPVDQLS